ncbi:hypothetical protein [Pseudactinotalea sp.]|uniref:hypothetical protein n=1 Tax=Pseudactinotalea sp. TaxID=1926260 RepID=UPI003B3B9CAD
MVVPTNIRFADATQASLSRYVRATGSTKSSVINKAVDEWLRMQAHPRIRFLTVETGERRAALIDGPQVWTVAESWLAHDSEARSSEQVAEVVGIPVALVEAALAYWAEHRDEIDAIIDRHRTAQDEALEAWERRRALDAV